MRAALVGLPVLLLVGLPGPALAEPVVIGGSVTGGEALGPRADARVGGGLYVLLPIGAGFVVGGELGGSFEGSTGGHGCGATMTGEAAPAIAEGCLEPATGLHGLVGLQAAPTPRARLRLDLGLGATAVWLVPGSTASRRELVPSGHVRAAYLRDVGRVLGSRWWLGVALEERAVGDALARGVSLVFEGES